MYLRTEAHRTGDLAVVHTPLTTPFWPTESVVTDREELDFIRVRVPLFPQAEPFAQSLIDLTVETPAGSLRRWREHLTPPVLGPSPPFSLEEIANLLDGPAAGIRVSSEAFPFRGYAAVINTIHLDVSAIIAVVRAFLENHSGTAGYEVTWEFIPDPAYGPALYEYHLLQARAAAVGDREDFLAARSLADQFWMETLLPLELDAEANRVIMPPAETEHWRQWLADVEDLQLRGLTARRYVVEPLPPRLAADGMTALLERPDRRRIAELARWTGRFPDLPVDRALTWLDYPQEV